MTPMLKTLPILVISANAFGGCPMPEGALMGSWRAASPSAPFEEMSFEKEDGKPIFNSWRHSRPDWVEGAWRMEGCSVHILHASEKKLNVDLTIVKASAGEMVVRDGRSSRTYTYRRIEE